MKNPKVIRELLKNLREEKFLSYEELSELTGITAKHIRKIEKGEQKNITLKTLNEFCIALDCNWEDLLITGGYIKENPQTLGEVLLKERLLENKSPEEFSQIMGITGRHLVNIEKGLASPHFSTLQMIARALNIDIKELKKLPVKYISD